MTDESTGQQPASPERRRFLRQSAVAGGFLGLGSLTGCAGEDQDTIQEKLAAVPGSRGESVMGLRVDPMERVRLAIIGLGMRGLGLLDTLCHIPADKFDLVALCDVRREQVQKAEEIARGKGFKPATYSGSEDAWQEMLRDEAIDLVIVATPWSLHVPMAVHAMGQGVHVGVEVPAAYSLEDCWALVDTAEETQRNCMMLENVCYGDEETWLLNMVRQGVFGELTYAEAAYIHKLSGLLFDPDGYYQQWRLEAHMQSTGNLYPTHGLGPVAQYLGVLRGDNFDYLVSMSSPSLSLDKFAQQVDSGNPFYGKSGFAHGDMCTNLIKTAQGRTIMLQHDVVTHRPYSRINALAGTEAFHQGWPSRLASVALAREAAQEDRQAIAQSLAARPQLASQLQAIVDDGESPEAAARQVLSDAALVEELAALLGPSWAERMYRYFFDDSIDHDWLPEEVLQRARERYRHPLWSEQGQEAMAAGGHGGMDYLMLYRLIDNLNKGEALDMDVYDGVAWSVVTPLSQLSEALGSAPVKFPDFTRGRWRNERELPIMAANIPV